MKRPDKAEYIVRVAHDEQERSKAMSVRIRVFVEEQGVPLSLERDEYDEPQASQTVVILRENSVVGTGRLRMYDETTAKIQRVAVLQEERGKGAGRALMNAFEQQARVHGFTEVVLDAQLQAEGFYGALGYSAEGEIFDDAGIDHIRMRKPL